MGYSVYPGRGRVDGDGVLSWVAAAMNHGLRVKRQLK